MAEPSYLFTYESASVSITQIDVHRCRLHNLRSDILYRGHARRIMEIIIIWADTNEMDLDLVVQGYGAKGIMSNAQLEVFYESFGFVRTDKTRPIKMTRTSQQKHGQ